MEYITQILSDSNKLDAKMDFNFVKIDSEKMCVLDIYVPETKFEKHLNLGIPNYHSGVLFEQVLNDLLHFLPSDTIGVSKLKHFSCHHFLVLSYLILQKVKSKLILVILIKI